MAHSTENTAQGPEFWSHHRLAGKMGSGLLLAGLLLSTAAPYSAVAQTDVQNTAPVTAEEPISTSDAPISEDPESEEPTVEGRKPIEPPLYRNREDRDMRLLAAKLDPDSVVWLDALEEQFLAIYEPEYTGAPQGAVLLLHGEGQHSSWPNTIKMIRSSLPRFGWNTLSMSLPNPDVIPHPTRDVWPAPDSQSTPSEGEGEVNTEGDSENADATPEQVPEGGEGNEIFNDENNTLGDGALPPIPNNRDSIDTSAEVKIPVEDRTVARIRAAMSYLNDQGQFNIVLLGDGVGAARAGHFFSRLPVPVITDPDVKPIKPIRAVVIINARNHNPLGDINLTSSLFDPEVPTLDIFFGLDKRNAYEAEQRKRYAQRHMHKIYKQVQLPAMSEVAQQGENRLSRRIRGFLQEHARGIKVDNAIVNKY